MNALFKKLSKEAPGWQRRFFSIAEAAEKSGAWAEYQAWIGSDQGLAYINLGKGKGNKIDVDWLGV